MTSFITPHSICAYVIYKNEPSSKYLVLKRCGKFLYGTWQMISGCIDPGETAVQAASREIGEETGLHPAKLYSADAVETFYNQAIDKICFVPVFVAFVDQMEPIKLSAKEHDAYEWLSFEEAKDRLLWSEQKRIITHIHQNFVLKDPSELLKCGPNSLKATIASI